MSEIISFLLYFLVSFIVFNLIVLEYRKGDYLSSFTFNVNLLAPFVISSIIYILSVWGHTDSVFPVCIFVINLFLGIYHFLEYLELRKIHKHNLYYKKLAEDIRSIVYTERKNKNLPFGFESKFNYILDRILFKNFYSFDTDFTYDASPKFVDVIYRFRDVLRSYEKYSDEITYLYDSSSRPPYTTEEEKEAIKHLFAIIDEYQEEAFDLLGLDRSQRYQVTEDKAWTRYRNLTWHDYLYRVNWRNWKQSNESTTPENQDEVNK